MTIIVAVAAHNILVSFQATLGWLIIFCSFHDPGCTCSKNI
jgi:hypothetical protein